MDRVHLVLLLLLLHLVHASITIENTIFPTVDYFMVKYPTASRNGVLVNVMDSMAVTPSCKIANDTLPPYSGPPAEVTVLLADPFRLAPCHSYAMKARLLHDWSKRILATKGYHAPFEVLFGAVNATGYLARGGPVMDDYQGRIAGHEDGAPIVPVMIMEPRHVKSVVQVIKGVPFVSVVVEHEAGRWTDAFTSLPYTLLTIVLLVVNASTLLIAVGRLLVASYARAHIAALVLYIVNVMVTIALFAQLFLRTSTFAYRALDYYVGWTHNLSFLIVLLNWINMLKRYGIEETIRFVRFILHFALLVSFLRFIHIAIELCNAYGQYRYVPVAFFWLVLTPTNYTVSLVFLFYAYRFYRRKRKMEDDLKLDTVRNFNRLVWLSMAGFVCALIVAILNQLITNAALMDNAKVVAMMYGLRHATSTARSTALLLLLSTGTALSLRQESALLFSKLSGK